MKVTKTDVKSKSQVVSVIDVPEYDSVKEAVDKLSDKICLELINRQHKADLMNTERASKTRTTSPAAALARAAKSRPDVAEALNALLIKFKMKDEVVQAASEDAGK